MVTFDLYACQAFSVASWACQVYCIALFLFTHVRAVDLWHVPFSGWSHNQAHEICILHQVVLRDQCVPAVLLHIQRTAAQSHSSLCHGVPGTPLWMAALSRVATQKLFIEWGPHLYFYISVKHLSLQKAMASSCPTWFAWTIFILVSKGIMSLGIKIHQHMFTRKNIGVMFIGL